MAARFEKYEVKRQCSIVVRHVHVTIQKLFLPQKQFHG